MTTGLEPVGSRRWRVDGALQAECVAHCYVTAESEDEAMRKAERGEWDRGGEPDFDKMTDMGNFVAASAIEDGTL